MTETNVSSYVTEWNEWLFDQFLPKQWNEIVIKMNKINSSQISPEEPKAKANKTDIYFMILLFLDYLWKFVCNTIQYMIY